MIAGIVIIIVMVLALAGIGIYLYIKKSSPTAAAATKAAASTATKSVPPTGAQVAAAANTTLNTGPFTNANGSYNFTVNGLAGSPISGADVITIANAWANPSSYNTFIAAHGLAGNGAVQTANGIYPQAIASYIASGDYQSACNTLYNYLNLLSPGSATVTVAS